ncbi:MAG TPA: hypothetical protein VKW06_10490 [Candidatus Angelobacter sp.]|nr:hypothetical protein [Candidatus Angelobacter sp.]
MKVAIDSKTETLLHITAETMDDHQLLTKLWDRMVIGGAIFTPGTETVQCLSVELKFDPRAICKEIQG